MIIEKLASVEFKIENNIRQEQGKLEAVKNISKLLKQIDFTAEEVPFDDPERMRRLISSLKGETLNSFEIKIVNEVSYN